MAVNSRRLIRALRRIAGRVVIVVVVVLFNFAVIGVFGLPCAIVSSVLGIGFSIVTVIVTNKRADRASQ